MYPFGGLHWWKIMHGQYHCYAACKYFWRKSLLGNRLRYNQMSENVFKIPTTIIGWGCCFQKWLYLFRECWSPCTSLCKMFVRVQTQTELELFELHSWQWWDQHYLKLKAIFCEAYSEILRFVEYDVHTIWEPIGVLHWVYWPMTTEDAKPFMHEGFTLNSVEEYCTFDHSGILYGLYTFRLLEGNTRGHSTLHVLWTTMEDYFLYIYYGEY